MVPTLPALPRPCPPFFGFVCLVVWSFLVVSLSLLCRRTGPPRTDAKRSCHVTPCFVLHCGRNGPSHGFLLVLALRLKYESEAYRWFILEFYINVEHFTGMMIPTPGLFLVLASRLTYENKAYRWSITFTTLASLLWRSG